jgi:cytochrome c-type biogenesis protein CcmH
MRRNRATAALALAVALPAVALPAQALPAAGAPPAARAATARTSLPAIESQAMCVTCKIPLQVAQSPQADRERAFIERLIVAGLTEAQIKRALVREYGPAVLALPSTHGFGLAAYIVPPCAMLAVLGLLALLLPRWRRGSRAALATGAASRASPALSPADAARLDADIARFE